MDVLTRIAAFTSPRGWLLIVLTAVGGYFAFGMLGAFAFTLGTAAGLSASGEWEVESDVSGPGTPPPGGRSWDAPSGRSQWRRRSSSTLDFTSLHHPMLTFHTPAYS
jgi:hypothetical protein